MCALLLRLSIIHHFEYHFYAQTAILKARGSLKHKTYLCLGPKPPRKWPSQSVESKMIRSLAFTQLLPISISRWRSGRNVEFLDRTRPLISFASTSQRVTNQEMMGGNSNCARGATTITVRYKRDLARQFPVFVGAHVG